VACACARATTADVTGEILLIAGDESHRRCYGDLTPAVVSALGMPNAMPPGRPGNPDSDEDWFATDWMDTSRAQEALEFQHYSWPDMLAEMRAQFGWNRYPLRLLTPIVRAFLKRRGAYWNAPGQYADPWGAIRAKIGDPSWDRPYERS
jgi:hypothetical protein